MVLPGRGISVREFFKLLKQAWKRDRVYDLAASLTFFWVLALFPFLLALVSLAALIIDPELARALVDELGAVAPEAVTQIVGARIESLGRQGSVELLTISFAGALWLASNGIAALIRGLNVAYGVRESRPIWKVRGIALAATLLGSGFVIVATIIMVATPAIARSLGSPIEQLVVWLRLPIAGLVIMLVWALLYYFLPDLEQRFRFLTPGSIVGVVAWLVTSWAFSLYVTHFGSYEVTYGALGGVIVLLFWMWITAQMLLLGAEMNAILEHRSEDGKRVSARTFADAGSDRAKLEGELARLPAPSAVGPAVARSEVPAARTGARPRRARITARNERSLPLIAAVAIGFFLGSRSAR